MTDYDRDAMRAELGRDEGRELRAYKDTVGKWSIGVGRNLDDVGIRPAETAELGITRDSCIADGIDDAQCDALFDGDLDHAEAALDRNLPWWRALDPVRQRVILNMCFNMGIATLCTFHITLGAIQRGAYALGAADMLDSRWAHQVGARATRLAAMMQSGEAA
jgi:lysozyme